MVFNRFERFTYFKPPVIPVDYDYKKFIDPLGFNKNNENHKINLVILLNGIEVISLNNLAITKGQLYSGQLNFNVSDSFKGISVRYQKEIESK